MIKKDAGFVLRAENFSVAVGGTVSPGVEAIMNDLQVTEEAVNALENGKFNAEQRIEVNRRKVTWFLEMVEPYARARGAAGGEIGAVRIDGVGLRKVYARNVPA